MSPRLSIDRHVNRQRAFKGEEISDVLAAVLRQDLDWSVLQTTASATASAKGGRLVWGDAKK